MTLPERGLFDFGSLANMSMEAFYRCDVDALAHELIAYGTVRLVQPLQHIQLTFIVDKACRAIVVERTDGRHCWLSLGKKQQLHAGPSGWVNVSGTDLRPTVCGDRPYVFRPSSETTVTCLSCLAAGLPPHLQ